MVAKIQLICDECDKVITGKSGYAAVERKAVYGRAERLRAWREANPEASLRSAPSAVPWRLVHQCCDRTPDQSDFKINSARLKTERAVLRQVADLAVKSWTRHTDLRGLIAAIIAANPEKGRVPSRYKKLARSRERALQRKDDPQP